MEYQKSNYRIVEYKDYFTIEKKHKQPVYKYFLGFKYKVGKSDCWNTVMKKEVTNLYTERFNAENYQFKTKEECLQWIADKEKYPIYHNL